MPNKKFEGKIALKDLDNAMFTYDFITKKSEVGVEKNISIKEASKNKIGFIWQGKNKQKNYKKVKAIRGLLKTLEIHSSFLKDTTRKISLYLPPKHNKSTPIIYMTDGIGTAFYAHYVDELIHKKKISPVILAGIHSSKDRYFEYVENRNNKLFTDHETFVYHEAMTAIEKQIKEWSGRRFFYGFSNGAAFTMQACIHHGELFEEIIAFSTVGYISSFYNPIVFNLKEKKYPLFYLGAGKYEKSVFENNLRLTEKLEEAGINHTFIPFLSGHDHQVWLYEFLNYLEVRFKSK